MTDLMLIAGGDGSKSTFIGGLYNHAKESDDIVNATYDVLSGDASEFEQNVVKRMSSKRKYPKETTGSYAVEFRFDGAVFEGGYSIRFIDIPGQQQQKIIQTIESGLLDKREIDNTYESEVKPKLEEDNKKLQPSGVGSNQNVDDWEILYKWSYIHCDNIIFLLNLHKVINEAEDPIYSRSLLTRAANDKAQCALVVTAVDLLDYNPDSADISSGLLGVFERSGQEDEDLVKVLNNQLNHTVSPKADNVVNTASAEDRIDFFSVSVPPENPQKSDPNKLVRNRSSFKMQGFDNVLDWL